MKPAFLKTPITYLRLGRRIFASYQKQQETEILLNPCLSSGHSLLGICANEGLCVRLFMDVPPLAGLQGPRELWPSVTLESAFGTCAPALILFSGGQDPRVASLDTEM